MTVEVYLSPKLTHRLYSTVPAFLQQVANRLSMGRHRYGDPDKGKQYMRKLEMELRAYKKTGNYEQLLNIAVYAWLESVAPENGKFHFDATVESVTRGKV